MSERGLPYEDDDNDNDKEERELKISSVYEAAPDLERISEDAYFFYNDSRQITLFVADGASQRAKATKLQSLIDGRSENATLASYAAQTARETVAVNLLKDNSLSPKELLLSANAALCSQLEQIYGELTADAVLSAEPDLTFLRDDPRLVRLILPVCVATLAKVDLASKQLAFAHAGDTALFLFQEDGQVIQLTEDQMEAHDQRALTTAKTVQAQKKPAHFSDAITEPSVREVNRMNGIYHNFIDGHGQTNKRLGVGVINGLSQLSAYVQEGIVDVSGAKGILLCSDGFVWPATWHETAQDGMKRLEQMRAQIERSGLSSYLAGLRAAEQTDKNRDIYPRFKVHDDATAIYLETCG